jgi:hypothetical protein
MTSFGADGTSCRHLQWHKDTSSPAQCHHGGHPLIHGMLHGFAMWAGEPDEVKELGAEKREPGKQLGLYRKKSTKSRDLLCSATTSASV